MPVEKSGPYVFVGNENSNRFDAALTAYERAKVDHPLSPQPTARDLARFAPPWWMVLLAVVVGLMLVAWVVMRVRQAIYEGGR